MPSKLFIILLFAAISAAAGPISPPPQLTDGYWSLPQPPGLDIPLPDFPIGGPELLPPPGPSGPLTPTPEPGTFGLLGAALAGGILLRRRR